MRLTTTLARRSLVERPGRTVFSILGIAVGIATVVAIFTLDHNTILGLSQPDARDWKAGIEVSPNVRVADPKKDLAGIEGVAAVSAFFQNDVYASDPTDPRRGTEDAAEIRVRLYALEAGTAPVRGLYRIEEGRDIDPRSLAPEVVIGRQTAEELALEIGDTVRLERPRRAPRRVCVDGELKLIRRDDPLPPRADDFRVVGIAARERLGAQVRGRLVIIDHPAGVAIFEGAHVAERFLVEKDPDADLERLRSSLGEAYSYEINQKVIVGQAADERAFRNGVRFAGLLAMVLGLFVIFHTLSIALLERMREIATLHALGADRAQIGRVFFVEALVLAVGGGVLGLALGLALAKLLLAFGITTLGTGKHIGVFEVPWDTVLPLVLTGCGIALLGSIYPLLRMREASAVLALRGEDAMRASEVSRGFRVFSAVLLAVVLPALYFAIVPVVGEARTALVGVLLLAAIMVALLVGLPLLVPELIGRAGSWLSRTAAHRWPLAGRLASRTMRERPARIAASVVAIAMVAAAFTALEGMTNSLSAEIEVWAEEAVVDKVFVNRMDQVTFSEFRDRVAALPGVLGVESADIRTYAPFLVEGLHADELAKYGPLTDDALRRRFVDERGIILSRRLARDLGYEVGQDVQMLTGQGTVERFPVIAITDAYGFFPYPDERMYGVVSAAVMRRYFCLDTEPMTRCGIRIESGRDPQAALAAIRDLGREHYPGGSKWLYDVGLDVRDFALFDITRDFFLFDVILLLTALLAALGILNGQLLSALERTKELGILKALGATRAQIAGMTLIELTVIGVLGGVLGVALGAALTPVVVSALEVISALDLPHRNAGPVIPLAVLGAVLVALLAALYPIYRMNRMDPVRAVRAG